jgi:hypothetical protein
VEHYPGIGGSLELLSVCVVDPQGKIAEPRLRGGRLAYQTAMAPPAGLLACRPRRRSLFP